MDRLLVIAATLAQLRNENIEPDGNCTEPVVAQEGWAFEYFAN